jgi:WD40 repeat protein
MSQRLRIEAWAVLAAALTLLAGSTGQAREDRKPRTLAEAQRVSGLVYSPDGRFLLVSYAFGSLGIWDARTGRLRVKLQQKAPSDWDHFDISPDGKKVAAIDSVHRRLHIWDTATGKLVEEQTLPKNVVAWPPFLKFSADGAFLYSIWDPIVRDRRILEAKVGGKNRLLAHNLDGWSATPNSWRPELIAFDPNARLLIVAHNNDGKPGARLGLFPCAGGKPRVERLRDQVGCLALTRDGKTLAVAVGPNPSEKAKLEIWDVAAFRRRKTVVVHPRKDAWCYHVMAFAPDGKTLAGAPGRTEDSLDVIDLDGKILQEIPAPSPISALQFSPDGKTLAVSGSFFVDPATGKEKPPPGTATAPVVQKKPRKQNEAEKIFRAMEKKVLQARALKAAVSLEVKAIKGREADSKLGGKTVKYKGTLRLMREEGNKMWLTIHGDWGDFVDGGPMTLSVIGEGRFLTVQWGRKKVKTYTAPEQFHHLVTTLVLHQGVATHAMLLGYGNGPPTFRPVWPKVDGWDFKLARAEKVGGREAQVIRYQCGYAGGDSADPKDPKKGTPITVWIDKNTLLPLKHVIAVEGHLFTEFYHFTLDPKAGP